jgi:hypothetical protein
MDSALSFPDDHDKRYGADDIYDREEDQGNGKDFFQVEHPAN